jgi:hypothetical protein
MYIPDDKDIDRISREAAGQYHAPGNPDWNTLRQTLDKELPEKKEKKRRGFFFFFFLVMGLSVTGSLVWYGVSVSKKIETIARSAEKNKIPLKQNSLAEGNAGVAEKDAKKTYNNPVKTVAEQVTATRKTVPGNNGSVTGTPVKDGIALKNDKASVEPVATRPAGRINTDNRIKKELILQLQKALPKKINKSRFTNLPSIKNNNRIGWQMQDQLLFLVKGINIQCLTRQ